MADPEYQKALAAGKKAYRTALGKGEYPYLPALDEFLPNSEIQTEVPLGLMDIPLDQIVGTKTAGRQQAFACNFMPLMAEKSEFALKWANLYKYQIDEGVKDPIICYEYMNKYYVLEGNKRVSVFKYLNAYSIEGNVTRIVPKYSSDPQVKLAYEYMEFYSRTGINYVWFTKEGSFSALIRLCGKKSDEIWTEDERRDFASRHLRFSRLFQELGGRKLSITVGDALVLYLGLYPYDEIDDKTDGTLRSEMEKIWKEFWAKEDAPEQALSLEPEDTPEAGMFTRFFAGSGSKQLNVAFIHDKPLDISGWVYSHDLGRSYLESVFGDKIHTTSYFLPEGAVNKQGVIESAIEDGNHILFTTSERFLEASLKCALEHPEVKILNCCVNRPYQALRTYYARMYEAKFLGGMIAGAMAENDKIAYLADYPIYGSIANINAFALGAQMVNPRAKIYLNWTSVEDQNFDELIRRHNIEIVSDLDMIRPGSPNRRYGLYGLTDGGVQNLAAPIWNWGRFYEKIIRDILSGSWGIQTGKTQKALNYWWGISGGIIDLVTSQKLPSGVRQLADLMHDQLYRDELRPFDLTMVKQDGSVMQTDEKGLSAEQIITMDYLAENVVGSIPRPEELNEDGRSLVRLQGIFGATEEP